MCKHFHLQASRGSSIRICTTHTHKTTAISKQICIRLSMPAVSQRCRWVMLHLSTPRFGESLCIYQLIYCQLCWEEYLFLQWKDPTTTKDTTIKKLKARPKLAPWITCWHPMSHIGTQHHMLAFHITWWNPTWHVGTPTSHVGIPHQAWVPHIKCWHPISHIGTPHHMLVPHIIIVGTPYHMLAPHITCWHPTSHVGTPYHMLAPHITCWHPTSHVGSPHHMLALHITCWHPTSCVGIPHWHPTSNVKCPTGKS